MRVTSIQPDWFYDEMRKTLYIHNPIERFQAGVFANFPYDFTEQLPLTGAQWVKEFSLEQARYTYGEVLAKYSGAIPGPLKDLQMDTQKRDKAEARIEKLKEKLQGMSFAAAISVD